MGFDLEEIFLPAGELPFRFQAKKEHLARFKRHLPGGQGQNLALTVLYVPYSLDSDEGGGDGVVPRDFCLTESVYTVVSQKSSSAQIRQHIIHFTCI